MFIFSGVQMHFFRKRRPRVNPSPDDQLKSKDEGAETKSAGGCYRSSLVHQNGTRNIMKESKTKLCRKANSQKFWSSATSKDYHKHTPLLVKPIVLFYNDELDGSNDCIEVHMDDKAQLGMILAQNRKLPGTWYYSSIHVLVNKARVKRGIPAVIRRIELDDLARKRAEEMALFEEARHEESGLVEFRLHPYRRFGENVASGSTIRQIFNSMIINNADRNNIMDRRYAYIGAGTALAEDGTLFMCQLYRG